MLTRRATLAGLAVLGLPLPARAQGFPNRTITIVVPYPPGGPIDIMARLVAQEAAAELRQSVVVENRPGGSGIIGSDAVARAEPDGYTLVFGTSQTHVINQSMIKNWPFDAVKDFSPVAGITVDAARAGGAEGFASSKSRRVDGDGQSQAGHSDIRHHRPRLERRISPPNCSRLKAGIDMLHVPFKGLAPLTTELLAGRDRPVDCAAAGADRRSRSNPAASGRWPWRARSAPSFCPSLPTFAEGGRCGRRSRRIRRAVCAGQDAARGDRPAVSSDGRGGDQGTSGRPARRVRASRSR